MATLLGKFNAGGIAQIAAQARASSGAAGLLAASATLTASPSVQTRASVALAQAATIAASSLLPTPTAAIRLVTEDALGNPVAGLVRLRQVQLGAVGATVFVPLATEAATTGDLVLSIPTGIEADYYFTPAGQSLSYFIGRLTATSSGLFGSLVRERDGAAVGAQSYFMASGKVLTRAGVPAVAPRLAVNGAAITRDGTVIIPVATPVPLNPSTGSYLVQLAKTSELHALTPVAPLYRMTDRAGVRIGTSDFAVPAPAGESLAFTVIAGALALTEGGALPILIPLTAAAVVAGLARCIRQTAAQLDGFAAIAVSATTGSTVHSAAAALSGAATIAPAAAVSRPAQAALSAQGSLAAAGQIAGTGAQLTGSAAIYAEGTSYNPVSGSATLYAEGTSYNPVSGSATLVCTATTNGADASLQGSTSMITTARLQKSAASALSAAAAVGASGSVNGGGSNEAQLPLVTPTAQLPNTSGYQVYTVGEAGDTGYDFTNLQTALNTAASNRNSFSGILLKLKNGGTWTGNFDIPTATGNPIVVQAVTTSYIPTTRKILPSDCATAPKIRSTNALACLTLALGGNNWYFNGLDIGMTNTTGSDRQRIISVGGDRSAMTTQSQIPDSINFKHCYVHCDSPTDSILRGFLFNGKNSFIYGCYVSGIHHSGSDSQAILGWNGMQGVLVEENFLEATGENVMIGGADAASAAMLPADLTFRRNHIYKPLSWKENDPSYAGQDWAVKNIFELKLGLRILIEGNVFENCWSDAQTGYALNIKQTNQDGTAGAFATTKDVTIRKNVIRHCGLGVGFLARENEAVPAETVMERIVFENNLMYDVTTSWHNGITAPPSGSVVQMIQGPPAAISQDGVVQTNYLRIRHNTMIGNGDTSVSLGDTPVDFKAADFIFEDNILYNNVYSFKAGGMGPGEVSLAAVTDIASGRFQGNVLIGGSSAEFPTINAAGSATAFPANAAAVGFVDAATAGDNNLGGFALSGSSPYRAAGASPASDGTDRGCDVAAVIAATNNVVIFSPDASASLNASATMTAAATIVGSDVKAVFNGVNGYGSWQVPSTGFNAMGSYRIEGKISDMVHVSGVKLLAFDNLELNMAGSTGAERLDVFYGGALGGDTLFRGTSKTNFLFRLQVDMTANLLSLELWNHDGTNRQESTLDISSLGQVNFNDNRFGVGANGYGTGFSQFKASYVRWVQGAVALNSTPPQAAPSGTHIGQWEFENNGNDSSGNGRHLTMSNVTYE